MNVNIAPFWTEINAWRRSRFSETARKVSRRLQSIRIISGAGEDRLAVALYAIQIYIWDKLRWGLSPWQDFMIIRKRVMFMLRAPFANTFEFLQRRSWVLKILKATCTFHVMDAPAILIGGLQLPVSVPFIWNKFVRCEWLDPVSLKARVRNVAQKLKLESKRGLRQRAAPASAVSKNRTCSTAE